MSPVSAYATAVLIGIGAGYGHVYGLHEAGLPHGWAMTIGTGVSFYIARSLSAFLMAATCNDRDEVPSGA